MDPRLDLVPVPLQLLDLFLEVRLELLLLVRILGVVDLPPKKLSDNSPKSAREKIPQDQGEWRWSGRAYLVPDAVEDVDALLDLLEDAVDLALQLPTGAHGGGGGALALGRG